MDTGWRQLEELKHCEKFDPFTGYIYLLSDEIGYSVKESGRNVPVHKAQKSSPLSVNDVSQVAVQLCPNEEENNIVVRRLKAVHVSPHDNLLILERDFITSNNEYLAVYPLMTCSMRALLNDVYQEGLPENLIGVVVKETLKAINHLHEESKFVYTLNSGSVYCKFGKSETSIKIGYGCSTYEHKSDLHPNIRPMHLDLSKICKWGCAPEITTDYTRYSKKAEIWLVGLLGLDLFFGRHKGENKRGFIGFD